MENCILFIDYKKNTARLYIGATTKKYIKDKGFRVSGIMHKLKSKNEALELSNDFGFEYPNIVKL